MAASRPPSLQELRNETARQLDKLLKLHDAARSADAGWTGLPADIASLSEALASLDRRLNESWSRP